MQNNRTEDNARRREEDEIRWRSPPALKGSQMSIVLGRTEFPLTLGCSKCNRGNSSPDRFDDESASNVRSYAYSVHT
eukprot:scaffold10860_cov182-Amphora_coffeaeformis.AAC.28